MDVVVSKTPLYQAMVLGRSVNKEVIGILVFAI